MRAARNCDRKRLTLSSHYCLLFVVTRTNTALRTAADVLSGSDLLNVDYHEVRGLVGIKESTVNLGKAGEIGLNVAVCNQMKHVREFLDQIETGDRTYRKYLPRSGTR